MEKRSFLQYAEQELGKVPKFFIYVVLEWVIILILFIDGFLGYLANVLAKWFGLAIPCLLCTRIENEHFYYNQSICSNHKKNVSCLAFCHAHKKLSDMRNLCENCLLSFATEKETDCHNYKSLLGILHKDIELFLDEEQHVHLSLPSGTKDEVVQKRNDYRCACCGEPLKVKLSNPKWKSSYLSSFTHAPSPRVPVSRNFSSHIKCSSFKLNSSSAEPEVLDRLRGTTMERPLGEHVKAGSLPLLIDAEEAKTPSSTWGNKLSGISLGDSAANSPRWTRVPRKSPLEKTGFASESAEGQVPNHETEGDIWQHLKGQVRMDRKSLMSLYMELDEERSLSAEAANNAMAMITRLQAEKAAVQTEALQYQRMTEEQAEYDQETLQEMYNLLVKTEEELQGLQAELEAYRQKYGFIKDINFPKQSVKTDDRNHVMKLLSYSFNGRTECGTPTFRRTQAPKPHNLEQVDEIKDEEAIEKPKKVRRGIRHLGRLKNLDKSGHNLLRVENDSDMEEETGNGRKVFTIESDDEDTDHSYEVGINRETNDRDFSASTNASIIMPHAESWDA
ncbi:hypothetical protein V6N13_029381 [Hibiscus sabdariffa]